MKFPRRKFLHLAAGAAALPNSAAQVGHIRFIVGSRLPWLV